MHKPLLIFLRSFDIDRMTDSFGFCKYRNIFGTPGEGAHAWRVAGLAGNDLLITALVGAGAAFALNHRSVSAWLTTFLIVFIVLIIIGIASHYVFCVDTALNQFLGLYTHDHST